MKNTKWLNRIISLLLVFAMMLTAVPSTVFAAKAERVEYGDVNGDGTIDVKDVLVLQKHILGVETQEIHLKYADVNGDSAVDLKDLLNVKKYLAEWDIVLGPSMVTVSFYDGDRLVDELKTEPGEVLGQVPTNEKASRSDAIFLGWFTDPECTIPFYPDVPVEEDTKVYAKYSGFDTSTLTLTSFAQLDLAPDASFQVVGSGDIAAITLTPMDGSVPVKLQVEGSGPYTVFAPEGFKEGASYELTLPEGLNFVGSNGETMPDTIRTASFTIAKDLVHNLQMNDAVHYVQHANPAGLAAGSEVVLSGVAEGDLLCFYHTTNPQERDYISGNAYMDDPETWFKAAAVAGDTVTLAVLDEADQGKMYDVPDNFPVIGELPGGETGTLTLAGDADGYILDTELYTHMVEKAEDATLENAMAKLGVGDFLSIYVSSDGIDEQSDIYFAKVTAVQDGVITYVKSSAQEIEAAADLYIKPVLEGDDLVSEEAKQEIEETVLEQLSNSDFATEAAYMLAELAAQTDGFRNMEGVQALLTDENGQPLSEEAIQLLNLGASFELSDDIKLTVELITSGDQLHFQDKGSVQLGVGIDATFEVEAEEGKLVIDLSAAFVQELAIGVTANGSLVKKEILFIPVPVGVQVSAAVDLLSYTGVRVDVQGYTVGEEETSLFEQLMDVAQNPEKLADVLPDSGKFKAVAEGLKTVGEVFDKIEELEGKIQQLQDDADTALAYTEDLMMLWDMVGEMNTDNKMTKEEWEQMGQALGKTNVSEDLMEMLNLSTETELDADRYAEGLNGLLEKYSEMLEKETDWITLVEKEICTAEINIIGLVIYCRADFVVRADVNIAMGASLQYEVGKRYSFWFKIGLFKPEAGSSTMDLVDESFAFQFYVMGKIGLKAGIKATVGFALGSSKLARVGLSLEMGPYVKLYGFFIYEYSRLREANTTTWQSSENMAGALYVDFGLYLVVSMDAAALGDLFEVEYTFLDEEFPLLEAGTKQYPYAFLYEPMEDELVLVQDVDENSTTGITMVLPDDFRALSYCQLDNGFMGACAYDWENYHVMLSNPAFSIDKNGEISVDVPEGTRYMECDLTLTYKYGKLAFSTYDMQVVVPLVWTNLSTDEISQYYTVSVRVGNITDGYNAVWSKRVRKNEEFTLPTEEELKELIGYNETIYSDFSYPDAGKTVDVIANTSYDCTVAYTDYAVTVTGIQNPDGTVTSETFHTTYGGTFDFSRLNSTGTSIPGTAETAKFTKFVGVETTATITANGQTQVINLSQPITGKVAEAVRAGAVEATAVYGDDSALVTYIFTGIDAPNITERVRKGTEATYDIYTLVAEYGMSVKDIVPGLGPVHSTTTYYVECGKIVGEKYTLSFEENGGDPVDDIVRVGGSIVGTLPTPTRTGHTFDGWFADAALTVPFEIKLMPKENITAYAKWTANAYTLTLHVNGGNAWEGTEGTMSVTQGTAYGQLPVPVRDGHSFQGWYTTQTCDDGTQVNGDTVVSISGDHTLYAKWHKLVEITGTFTYTAPETNPVYSKGVAVEIQPDEGSWPVIPEGAPALEPASFTFKFMRQGDSEYAEGYPVNAGTYDVTISRPADNYYAPFSQTITGVLTIDKATRTIEQPEITVTSSGFSYIDLRVADNAIDDLHPKAQITYVVEKADGTQITTGYGGSVVADTETEAAHVIGLYPDTDYAVLVSIQGDPNYHDAVATSYSPVGRTAAAPTDSWKNHMEPFEIVEGVYEYTITTPGQLAYLAYLVNTTYEYTSERDIAHKDMFGVTLPYVYFYSQFGEYTFRLGADIDLSAYTWEPIGRNTYQTGKCTIVGKNGNTYEATAEYYANFGGAFYGDGHTISGMYVDGTIAQEAGENSYVSSTQYGALFGYIHGDAYITEVTLINSFVKSAYHSAAVVSHAVGTKEYRAQVDTCYSEATVVGQNTSAAGIVYHTTYADILDLINAGRVISVNEGRSGILVSAGICGEIKYTNMWTCANYGNITGRENLGGIVGYMMTQSHVVDCVNYGSIKGTSTNKDHTHFGGVAGYVLSGNEVVNCANFGSITARTNCVGGVTGEHEESKSCKTINCVNYGTVSGNVYVGSVIGRNYSDEGTVAPVFYQTYAGCPYAAGTKNGSSNTVDNVTAYPFNTPDSTLQSNLNGWSDFENYDATTWVEDVDGYGYIPQSVYTLLYGE